MPSRRPPERRPRPRACIPAALGLVLAALLAPSAAAAHGEAPRVRAITFPAALGGRPLLLTDTQGAFGTFGTPGRPDDGLRWLCDDAVAPSAGISAIVLDAPAGRASFSLAVASAAGAFFSEDGGCTFTPAAGLPVGVVIFGLWPHPERPNELLTAVAEAPELPRVHLYRSEDGGRTFAPGPEEAPGVVHSLFRADDAPDVVYQAGPAGVSRSEDGGRTFTPLPLEVPGEQVEPASLYFLGGRPGTTELWATVQRVPDTLLLRSDDRGRTWTLAARLPDPVDSLAFDADGRRGLVATLFGSVARTDDAGAHWRVEAGPAVGFGCLIRGPDEALYACADPYQGAQFQVARSEDFGVTWTPFLRSFLTVTHRWECPADAPSTTRCADLCPGAPPGATCSLCGAGEDCEPAPDATPRWDAAMADAGPFGPADAHPQDLGPDATPPAQVGIQPGTCHAASTGRGSSGIGPWGLVALAALGVRPRRGARKAL